MGGRYVLNPFQLQDGRDVAVTCISYGCTSFIRGGHHKAACEEWGRPPPAPNYSRDDPKTGWGSYFGWALYRKVFTTSHVVTHLTHVDLSMQIFAWFRRAPPMLGKLPSDLHVLLYPGKDDDDSSDDDSSVGSFEPVACPSAHSISRGAVTSKFDSDSYRIDIDNHASRSFPFIKAHFEDLILQEMGNCRAIGDTPGSS